MVIDFTNFYDLLNPVFWKFFESKKRIRISFGGAGSGKSVEAFQEAIYKILAEPGHNYLICRKVAATNKTSTFALIQQLISNIALNEDPEVENIDLSHLFKINKTDMSITVRNTGYMIVFKGLDDIEKIKSITFPKGVLTDIVIEEASEISQKDFDQLNVRLRGRARVPFQITMLLNPIINTHWIKREFIDKKSYQKMYPVSILKTTYLDNKFIDADYRAVLEGYKDIDYEFYRVYCLGEWGAYGNIIFSNWSFGKPPCTEDGFDAIYCGLDFGYIHPQVIVKIGFKDGVMYTYDELCLFRKTNMEVINENKESDILHLNEKVICDSEDPSKIKEWVQNGYGAVGAIKGKGSVQRGIDFMKSQRWVIDDTKCPRTAQEVQVYHRKEDKDGNVLEDPVEIMDDSVAAHRYALEPISRSQGKPSVLSGKKSEGKKEILEIKKAERKNMREVLKAQRKEKKRKRKRTF
jgi:phage terminase large subunit